jgi:hypothetical protein
MLTPTNYTTDTNLFQEACSRLPEGKMKTTINQPTGNFFYDPWVLKEEYKGTVWETLYNSLPVTKGETRIIILDPGQAYTSHADIDDRYHLNILGSECFLIDLIREQMYKSEQDGIWYDMDAGFHHTAANFGRTARVQLVVRKLLKHNKIKDPVLVIIRTKLGNLDQARYMFDNHVSPWLNSANKNGCLSDFEYTPSQVKFKIDKNQLDYLKNYLTEEFLLIVDPI